jgi:hypothetical protein
MIAGMIIIIYLVYILLYRGYIHRITPNVVQVEEVQYPLWTPTERAKTKERLQTYIDAIQVHYTTENEASRQQYVDDISQDDVKPSSSSMSATILQDPK